MLLTSEMLETVSTWTSVELMISGEAVSRISTATESRRRALKDTPSPSPSFRSWCSSISVYWRVEPYMLTQAGPSVGRNPGGGEDSWPRSDCGSANILASLNWNRCTFIAVIWDLAQVNEVRSYGNIIDLIRVSYLDFYSFAKWREKLSEDDLLVPDWFIAALLNWSLPLVRRRNDTWWSTMVHIRSLYPRTQSWCLTDTALMSAGLFSF